MNVQSTRLIESDAPCLSAAIDNLRGIVVLMVIAVHAVLAYAAYATVGPFDSPPYQWRTFPIVDAQRFIGFDIFCAWANVFLMPLFFLVSGFFVWKSLERNGALRFALRRAARLGPPFVLGVAVIMPVAIYPAYAMRTGHPELSDYLRQLWNLPFWPDGPMWFLYMLLVFDLIVAGLYAAFPGAHGRLRRIAFQAARRPVRFLAVFFAFCALAYIPLGTVFGPMRWFQWGPFSFQENFVALYAVCFGAGIVLGASSLENGLFYPRFAYRWKYWMPAAMLLFAVWLLVSAETFTTATASVGWMLADAIALVPACFASCLCVLLLMVRYGHVRTGLLQSLQSNSFGMYWVHYALLTWLQFALLDFPLPAIMKAIVVFAAGTVLSWTIAVALRYVPVLSGFLGVGQRRGVRPVTSLRAPMPLPD